MAKYGKFIAKKFMDTKLQLFVGLDSEWLSYADCDAQSYTIVIATPIEYDDSSGILTFRNDKNQKFYISEEFIKMFWVSDSGFKLNDNTTSTIHNSRPRSRKRDIV